MRPLPRLLALTDDQVASHPDLGARAAAIAAAGSQVALVARLPQGNTTALTSLALKFKSLAAPPMAQVFVTGRVDIAATTGAQGVILRRDDLSPDDARAVSGTLPIISSVHSLPEALVAIATGSDGLLVGAIWPTATHPGQSAAGTDMLKSVIALGKPVWAIGGITPARAQEVHDLGGWGVAAISALWPGDDPYQSALELTKPWRTAETN